MDSYGFAPLCPRRRFGLLRLSVLASGSEGGPARFFFCRCENLTAVGTACVSRTAGVCVDELERVARDGGFWFKAAVCRVILRETGFAARFS